MGSQITVEVDDVFRHLAPMLTGAGRRSIVEIGSHDGRHSDLLRLLCRERPYFISFEPDQRNQQRQAECGLRTEPFAISDRNGLAPWHASGGETPGCPGRVHTDSGSIKRPTRHLEVHPWCTFDAEGSVLTRALDTALYSFPRKDPEGQFCLEPIDLIWCDVQGAQLDVIAGAPQTLARTTYLYIELHPEPLYDGEPDLEELHRELERVSGCGWVLVEKYSADVLFRREGA